MYTSHNDCLMLIILAPQFLPFVLISFGTTVNSSYANGLLYTFSAAVTPPPSHIHTHTHARTTKQFKVTDLLVVRPVGKKKMN